MWDKTYRKFDWRSSKTWSHMSNDVNFFNSVQMALMDSTVGTGEAAASPSNFFWVQNNLIKFGQTWLVRFGQNWGEIWVNVIRFEQNLSKSD